MVWHCIKCGIELPPGYRNETCQPCRIIEATQQAHQVQQQEQQQQYNNVPYGLNQEPVHIIITDADNFATMAKAIFFTAILLFVCWPFIKLFYNFFAG